MTQSSDPRDLDLWNRVVETERAFVEARMALFSGATSIVELVRQALHRPTERATALGIAKLLNPQQRQALFPDLLSLASVGHGLTSASRDLILSLPRDWVLSTIDKTAQPILEQGGYEEYQRLLELYAELDRDLALRLAQQAAAHKDPEVQEAGRDFLGRRQQRSVPD